MKIKTPMKGLTMTNDPKLKLMGEILAIISNSNDLAAMLEKMMNDDPKDDYTLDAVTLVTVIASMQLTAKLASNLFEENQSLVDNFIKLLKKHDIQVPEGI